MASGSSQDGTSPAALLPVCTTCQQQARSEDKYLPRDAPGVLWWRKKAVNKAGLWGVLSLEFMSISLLWFMVFGSPILSRRHCPAHARAILGQETGVRDVEEGQECGYCNATCQALVGAFGCEIGFRVFNVAP